MAAKEGTVRGQEGRAVRQGQDGAEEGPAHRWQQGPGAPGDEGQEVSDESTPGQRLDAALAALNEKFEDLREAVKAKAEEVGEEIRTKLDAVSDRIDEVRAAWGHDETDSDE